MPFPFDELRDYFDSPIDGTVTTSGEILRIRARRSRLLQTIEAELDTVVSCKHNMTKNPNNGDSIDKDGNANQKRNNEAKCSPSLSGGIPTRVLQPDYDKWYRPYDQAENDEIVHSASLDYPILHFDNSDMERVIDAHFPGLSGTFRTASPSFKIVIWAVCALYRFGGIVVGPSPSSSRDILQRYRDLQSHDDTMPLGIAEFVLRTDKASGMIDIDIDRMVFSPRHPLLLCTIHRLEQTRHRHSDQKKKKKSNDNDGSTPLMTVESFLQSFCDEPSWSASSAREGVVSSDSFGSTRWDTMSTKRNRHTCTSVKECCTDILHTVLDEPRIKGIDATLNVRLTHEDGAGPRSDQQRHDAYPIWPTERMHFSITNNATITANTSTSTSTAGPVIPHKIHQLWQEDIVFMQLPQLSRIRRMWQLSGWQHVFYTPTKARQYVEKHAPSVVWEAYKDMDENPQVQADIFRYLVLFREGGVFADADVLLETPLEVFLTPTMSFFVGIDESVAGDVDEPFCLCNSLIGAAPGHPFLQRVLQMVAHPSRARHTLVDIEQQTKTRQDDAVVQWKLRQATLPSLLSGSCALGMAINYFRSHPTGTNGRDDLLSYRHGWLQTDRNMERRFGDVLLLKVREQIVFTPDVQRL